MIKKSIASVLIILILINSVGCYYYSQIKKEDTEKLEEDDYIKITTLDEKVYYLTEVEIHGDIVRGRDNRVDVYPKRVVEIQIEEIAKMEVLKSHAMLFLTIYLVSGAIFIAWYYIQG